MTSEEEAVVGFVTPATVTFAAEALATEAPVGTVMVTVAPALATTGTAVTGTLLTA